MFSTARSRYIYTLRYFLFSASFFSVFCSATPISTAVFVPFGNESGTSESCFMPWFCTCSPYASSRLRSPRTALCVCVCFRESERESLCCICKTSLSHRCNQAGLQGLGCVERPMRTPPSDCRRDTCRPSIVLLQRTLGGSRERRVRATPIGAPQCLRTEVIPARNTDANAKRTVT